MLDEEYYLQATEELRHGFRDDALWAKAYAMADGNAERQTAEYLKLRVVKLRRAVLRDQSGQTARLVGGFAQAWWKPLAKLFLLLVEWGCYIVSVEILGSFLYVYLFENIRWPNEAIGMLIASVLVLIFAFAFLRRLRRRL